MCVTDTHWINPQYRLSLSSPDDDDSSRCSFVLQLEQKDRRRLRQKGMTRIDLGFVIYKVRADRCAAHRICSYGALDCQKYLDVGIESEENKT